MSCMCVWFARRAIMHHLFRYRGVSLHYYCTRYLSCILYIDHMSPDSPTDCALTEAVSATLYTPEST